LAKGGGGHKKYFLLAVFGSHNIHFYVLFLIGGCHLVREAILPIPQKWT
jgi:hypothetical protein